ncbi:MAG: NADH-quinone oxidoreductase subunit A [Candidatus Thermoplasmatota archaeon]|nr:NADH-quinone oxidoreductase subunit A [Candidatus Thermoplasmatota archaeon]MCL5731737.1 NADH-quinone oxidoreductase subunit A [Candidatus Thermoplasmatota archaeon]
MLYNYIAIGLVIVLLILAMLGLFAVLPSIGMARYDKEKKISLKIDGIISRLANESSPPVKDTSYLEPYESGEISRGYRGNFVSIQYYVIILLFVLFDIDMILLFPWAFNFRSLGLIPFLETLIFLAMPLFAVLYAFREKYMEWLK